jgi:spore maturation protein CgeB
MKILVASDLSEYALAHSFARAFSAMSIDHRAFDIGRSVRAVARLGRVGRELHRFLPVEAWMRKGNREFVLACKDYAPDLLLVFCDAPVLFGSLAFLRSVSRTRLVLYWPDPLTVLSQTQLSSAQLYDCVATYAGSTCSVFKQLGFRSSLWVPFAADTEFLGMPAGFTGPFKYDVTFAGGWRPEREAAFRALRRHFPQLRLAIYSRSWATACKDPTLRSCIVPQELVGRRYGELIRESRATLNQIDDTNFPAANMRFFEVLAAGGLELSSSCPEMADDLRDGVHLLYYSNHEELVDKMEWVLSHESEAADIRRNGHDRVLREHTYVRRVKKLLHELELAA